jgi:hypothetical protein
MLKKEKKNCISLARLKIKGNFAKKKFNSVLLDFKFTKALLSLKENICINLARIKIKRRFKFTKNTNYLITKFDSKVGAL